MTFSRQTLTDRAVALGSISSLINTVDQTGCLYT